MRNPSTLILGLLATALPAAAAAQQNLFPEGTAAAGVEVRQYSFGDGFGVDKLRQIAVPFGVVIPLGKRFSFDIGAAYATTTVVDTTSAHNSQSFSSLTDTQLRGSYTIGNDALVVSVMMNLPTGKETTTLSQFGVAASASSNFLLFPVNTYGSGFSVTPGVAAATSVGDWNLGIAGSVRINSSYTPFSDPSAKGVTYKPGVETRIRGGVDHLIGSSRLTAGLTFSTFSNDELRGGGFGSGAYDPGNRFLIDLGLVSPVAGGTLGLYAWNYYRSSSGSADSLSAAGPRENVFTAGVSGSWPISSTMSLEPVAEARLWSPTGGTGNLFGLGTALRIRIAKQWTFLPSVRGDLGKIRSPGTATSLSINGWDAGAVLRYGF